jgi:hypothetical protein
MPVWSDTSAVRSNSLIAAPRSNTECPVGLHSSRSESGAEKQCFGSLCVIPCFSEIVDERHCFTTLIH